MWYATSGLAGMNMRTREALHQERRRTFRRFKWVIGTPYFVQGTSNLTYVPILYFIKFTLGMGDAGGQLFDALRTSGWLVKPVWGLVSDRVPLFGYHRKSWYVLMAFLALVFWTLSALLALVGIRMPGMYLLTFNLAFSTYAFVDVVCDALMVETGRRLRRVSAFVNFQWTVLAIANAAAVLLGSWFQQKVEANHYAVWMIFLATGIPPLLTTVVGLRYIEEDAVPPRWRSRSARASIRAGLCQMVRWSAQKLQALPRTLGDLRKNNPIIWLLVIFLFFWKFSPSIGFIERSYLIDERGFDPVSFGVILALGSVTFLASILTYTWIVNHFPSITWYHYLYAMVALGVVSFPLSFYLYLDPTHPWWRLFAFELPAHLNPLPGWNRYQWFRLITQTILGFASIPAFLIPLTIAGQTVQVQHAGVSYAFLMSLSNVTDTLEGVVGAGLYKLLSQPWLAWLLEVFQSSGFAVAKTADTRTLILQMFVYISLLFTVLTIPFIVLLRRELQRQGIPIKLGKSEAASAVHE
jgi:BT1 family